MKLPKFGVQKFNNILHFGASCLVDKAAASKISASVAPVENILTKWAFVSSFFCKIILNFRLSIHSHVQNNFYKCFHFLDTSLQFFHRLQTQVCFIYFIITGGTISPCGDQGIRIVPP
jgi:hypothetical protein